MELPDFDQLVEMAQHRPQELEALRTALVEEVIASARGDRQRKLRGLQFQIDMARRKSKSPLGACIRISELMYESLAELRECLNDPWHSRPSEQIGDFMAPVVSLQLAREKRNLAGCVQA